MKRTGLIKYAKELRKKQTDAERKLWYYLRNRRFNSLKFRRQYPMGNYIVDYVCLQKKLIIELDGGQHAEQISYDRIRTDFLEDCGYKVLRFWNNEMLLETENVLEEIRRYLL